MEKVKEVGRLEFNLTDYRETEFNESVELSYELWREEGSELLSIEDYHYFCTNFAKAMGFAQKTIDEWFGDY